MRHARAQQRSSRLDCNSIHQTGLPEVLDQSAAVVGFIAAIDSVCGGSSHSPISTGFQGRVEVADGKHDNVGLRARQRPTSACAGPSNGIARIQKTLLHGFVPTTEPGIHHRTMLKSHVAAKVSSSIIGHASMSPVCSFFPAARWVPIEWSRLSRPQRDCAACIMGVLS